MRDREHTDPAAELLGELLERAAEISDNPDRHVSVVYNGEHNTLTAVAEMRCDGLELLEPAYLLADQEEITVGLLEEILDKLADFRYIEIEILCQNLALMQLKEDETAMDDGPA